MAPAFIRSPEKAILDGVREHTPSPITIQGPMNLTNDPERSADERAHARREALLMILTGPLVTAVMLAAWAAAGGGYFWPIWPMLGMSIVVLVALYRAFGPLPQTPAGAPDSRARGQM
jgi:hypothetical protein